MTKLLGSTYTGFSQLDKRFEVDFTEGALLAFFHPIFGEKASLLQWNATTLLPGCTERHKENVEFAHAVVLDKDCGDIGELDTCKAKLEAQGLAYFIHSSHSHRLPNKEHKGSGQHGPFDCFRVVLPVSRPVLPEEYKTLVGAVFAHVVPQDVSKYIEEAESVSKSTGKPPKPRGWDPASASIAQFWYGPGCPEDMVQDIVFDVRVGKPLDVDQLLTKGGTSGRFSKKRRAAKKAQDDLLEGVRHSKIGRALNKVARALEKAGCPLDHEELDVECRSKCPACMAGSDSLCIRTEGNSILMKCFAECDNLDILKLLSLSYSDLSAGPAAGEERAIQRAFNSDRTEPYTKAELLAMAPVEERWILQTGAGYFIRAPGGDYVGPVSRDHVVNKSRDLLAPASSAEVQITKVTAKGGSTDKTLGELMREYGQTPTAVSYSYCVQRSALDGHTFVQKTGLPEEFEPRKDKAIGHWLALFAGDHEEALLDWLATLTDLSRPTCAVCISGTSGAGKDLFIEGLARLWSGKSTSFQRAISRFNDALLNSPLVVANEQLVGSGDYQWNPVEALKTMVSDVTRTIEAKNQKSAQLEGALRVILATNQRGAFNLGRQPTQSDLVALDERILLVKPGQEAADFLVSLGGMETTIEWVQGGGLARHVMWLKKNRQVRYGTRFIVKGQGGMSDLLSADGKGSAVVLRALLKALCGRQKDHRICVVHQDEVWFSKANLMERWSMYEKSDVPEDMGEILGAICSQDKPRAISRGKDTVKMKKVLLSVIELAAYREGMERELEGVLGIAQDDSEDLET